MDYSAIELPSSPAYYLKKWGLLPQPPIYMWIQKLHPQLLFHFTPARFFRGGVRYHIFSSENINVLRSFLLFYLRLDLRYIKNQNAVCVLRLDILLLYILAYIEASLRCAVETLAALPKSLNGSSKKSSNTFVLKILGINIIITSYISMVLCAYLELRIRLFFIPSPLF